MSLSIKFFTMILIISISHQIDQKLARPKCLEESECHDNYPMYFCEENICERQNFNFYPMETIGFILIFISLVLSSSLGLGSTKVNVGISFLLLQMRQADAYPLANVAIFTSSFVHLIVSLITRSKQDPNMLMVDYGMVAAFLPFFMAGTMIGDIGTIYLPYIIILIIFVIISALFIYLLLKIAKPDGKNNPNNEYQCTNFVG